MEEVVEGAQGECDVVKITMLAKQNEGTANDVNEVH